ncbi:aldehyde dehydrogenase family protein, partial [Micrococcus sp. SIMBA_131]
MTNQHLYINGAWKQGVGNERELINPATEETIITIKEASQEQASTAVDAARLAFDESDWATHPEKRVDALRKLADLLERNEKTFAAAETENTGKPIREAMLDIGDSVACLRYYANLIAERETTTIEMSDGTTSKIVDEPIGVCGLVVPWSCPLLLGVWKIGAARAAGD